MIDDTSKPAPAEQAETDVPADDNAQRQGEEKEIGGRDGPDPTRFGDWEKNGRCIDF